jgi:hypothetical protein
MKTTISLDDRTFAAVKERAAAEGLTVSVFIAAVLDDAVNCGFRPEEERPFRLVTVGDGRYQPEIDFDRSGKLTTVDDENRYS